MKERSSTEKNVEKASRYALSAVSLSSWNFSFKLGGDSFGRCATDPFTAHFWSAAYFSCLETLGIGLKKED